MARRPSPPTLEQWGVMRCKYEYTDTPVEQICAEFGISSSTFNKRVQRWNWPRRRVTIPREGPPCAPQPVAHDAAPLPAALPDAAPAASPDGVSVIVSRPMPDQPPAAASEDTPLALRLQRAVERELAAIESVRARLGGQRAYAGESERAARALATLTRTLRELNTLQSQQPEPTADDDTSPAIDERRRALARKIDAFLAGQGGGVPDDAESEGA